jgi:hypothetical protein
MWFIASPLPFFNQLTTSSVANDMRIAELIQAKYTKSCGARLSEQGFGRAAAEAGILLR